MSVLVLVDGWEPAPWLKALQIAMPHEEVVCYPDVPDPGAVEYAMIWSPQRGVLDRFPNLKALFSLGAGVDHLLGDTSLPDVPVARIVDEDLTARMSEWVVGQVLLHHRQHLAYAQMQSKAIWRELRQPAAREVCVGIMGLGELGRDAAGVLNRVGFNLRGWSRTQKTIDQVETFHGDDDLQPFLAGTDFLICLLPLTSETEGLVTYDLLRQLRKNGVLGGPVFLNAGRGKIQVEDDLVRALSDGTLMAASLDVFTTEPLPKDSPFWALNNVIITPHAAASSNPAALSRLIAKQIAAHRAGKNLAHLVDMTRGY